MEIKRKRHRLESTWTNEWRCNAMLIDFHKNFIFCIILSALPNDLWIVLTSRGGSWDAKSALMNNNNEKCES